MSRGVENDTLEGPISMTTKFLVVLGRSLWNEVDASVSFDWPLTQVLFRVLGAPVEVRMSAAVGEDVLAVYVDGHFECKIGPAHGRRDTYLVVRNPPEDCEVRIVKISQSNMKTPVTIYDVWTSPSAQQDGGAPCIGPFDFRGGRPGRESTIEFVGGSDTSAMHNMAVNAHNGDDVFCKRVSLLDSNIVQGWPFFLADRLGIACPVVVALSEAGVHAGRYRDKSLTEYYPRVLCCRQNPNNVAPYNDLFADESGPLCVLVFVDGADFLRMPHDSPLAQKAFLAEVVSAHQALLREIRHRRPCSPIVSLYGDTESCSGCQSFAEQHCVSSNLKKVVRSSVAALGGAQQGFFSCMIQPDIRRDRHTDWAHGMRWSADAHSKFADGVHEALRTLVLHEGGRESEQCFPAMANLAAKLDPRTSGQASLRIITPNACGSASSPERPQGRGRHPQRHNNLGQMAEMGPGTEYIEQPVPVIETEKCGMVNEGCPVAEDSDIRAPEVFGVASAESTPLHDAEWMEDCGLVFWLVDPSLEGGDVATPMPQQTADFSAAANAGDAGVVHALLQSRDFAPSVKAFTVLYGCVPFYGSVSALHLAAGAGHGSVTECLLQSEIFSDDLVNSVSDPASFTALHMACLAGNDKVVEMLLNDERFTAVNALARVSHPVLGNDCLACSALDLAVGGAGIAYGHETVAGILLQHHRFHAADATAFQPELEIDADFHCDALHTMAFFGMADGMRAYLAWHARMRPGAAPRLGALWQAAAAGHNSIVELLAAHPCVDAIGELEHQRPLVVGEGNALHAACFQGHTSVVQAILGLELDGSYGAAINATVTDNNPLTALHAALLKHDEAIAKCLLHSKSFTAVNAVDSAGQTALHIACEEELEEISQEIIRHPCFTKHGLPCCSGKTAMMIAKEKELYSVIDALTRFG